jgi:hypothetical protein
MTESNKPKRGRPSKGVERDSMREPMREAMRPNLKMKAAPNWEHGADHLAKGTGSVDRLHIDPDLIPEGMSFQWVTDSVYGRPETQHRADFEKGGWTPVHGEDFDGQFDGMFLPKGTEGEIKNEGVVLMARPKELNIKAKMAECKKADEAVRSQSYALKEGRMPGITLDAEHPSAINSNRINKSVERLMIPEK